MAGIDISLLLSGAAFMDKRCSSDTIHENPALLAAVLQYITCVRKGKSIQVMMPYSNRLRDVADWYRQLWAESLGKKLDLQGREVYAGQTPIKALGATDQHSQLQLYNEGPNDKTITLLRVNSFGKDITIPKAYQDIEGLSYLSGHTMGELLNAECAATQMALTLNKRPNSCIVLPDVNAHTLGQLLFMLEAQTAYAGIFFNINTFDQPGVEKGKISTYALMGRKGYEKQAEQIGNLNDKLKTRKI
jgi:glucose-6-phosphate isomerase